MKVVNFFYQFLLRFRYPLSLPQDVANDLGIHISQYLSFQEFVHQLTHQNYQLTRLKRFMPREQAEAVFRGALKKEKFVRNSLFSYYFNEGWLEFILQFDEQSRLRRIYVQHKQIKSETGIELTLCRQMSTILEKVGS